MARQQTIRISGINIVTQPHKPEDYVDIFRYIKETNPIIPVRGDECIILTHIEPLDGKDMLNGIKGEILKFSKIGDNSAWVNIQSGDELPVNESPKIPPNQHPNGVYFDFVFYPKHKKNNHKFIYISQYRDNRRHKTCQLSPMIMNKYFIGLFTKPYFEEKFNTVVSTVIPSHEALQNVLGLEVLRKLTIVIEAPNPDDLGSIESQMLTRMERINASRIEEQYTYDGQSLQPDEEIVRDARVASTNGYVRSEGIGSNGRPVTLSTNDIPMRHPLTIDSQQLDAGRVALQQFNIE